MAEDQDGNLRIPESLWEQLVTLAKDRGTDPYSLALLWLADAVAGSDPEPSPRAVPSSSAPASAPRRVTVAIGNVEYVVSTSRFIIGRGSSCDLSLDDEAVDAQHASVELEDGMPHLWDLGSKSGVYYGSQRVRRKAIADRDRFRLGSTEIEFRVR
ncbi:MAG: FHA domain-containing protein [Polyangiaceae bacterium]